MWCSMACGAQLQRWSSDLSRDNKEIHKLVNAHVWTNAAILSMIVPDAASNYCGLKGKII